MFSAPHRHCPHCGMSLIEAAHVSIPELLDAGLRCDMWICACEAALQGWRGKTTAGELVAHDLDGQGHCPYCHAIPEKPAKEARVPFYPQPAKPKAPAKALGGVPL